MTLACRKVRMSMSDQLAEDIRNGFCPDCGWPDIMLGPRGALSRNIECERCGAQFNAHGGYLDLSVTFGADRIRGALRPMLCGRRRSRGAYFDDACETLRHCEYCGAPYRGPAVYCCINHAEADSGWEHTNATIARLSKSKPTPSAWASLSRFVRILRMGSPVVWTSSFIRSAWSMTIGKWRGSRGCQSSVAANARDGSHEA